MLRSEYLNIIQNVRKSHILDQKAKIPIILYIQTKIDKIETEIEMHISQQNAAKIREHYSKLSEFGSFNAIKMWSLKKKILPLQINQIVAKRDSSGNMISDKTHFYDCTGMNV